MDQLSYQPEFDRLKKAGRGTLRFERVVNDHDYVTIAHFHTSAALGTPVLTVYVGIYHNDQLVGDRREFTSDITADALEAFVIGRIVANERRKVVQ